MIKGCITFFMTSKTQPINYMDDIIGERKTLKSIIKMLWKVLQTEQKWPDSINKEMSPGTDKCRIFGICLHSRKPETKPGQSKSYEWSRTPRIKGSSQIISWCNCMESEIH